MATAIPTAPHPPAAHTEHVAIGPDRHATLASYPPVHGMRLHSLAAPAEFTCRHCHQQRETALIATTQEHAAVCPACFAQLSRCSTP